MATLIQSKQIEGIVTASVIEGQLSVSGSIIATGSQSIFSQITASAISSSGPIYGVRYDDIDGTPNFIAGSGIVITQVGDNITITNTGGGGGGVSGSAELISSVAQLNAYTGSNDIIILGLNQFTASIQSQVDSLIASTSSYETTGRGIISGSSQLYTDLDSRYALSGSVGGGSTDISALNQFTSSIQTQVDGLSAATSSYITEIPQGTISGSQQISDLGFVTSSSTSIPAGTISGSAQITALGFTSGSHTDIPSGVISGSTFTDFSSSVATDISNLESTLTTRVDGVEQVVVSRLDNIETFTSSIDARVTALEGATDLTGSDTQTLSIVGDQLTISSGNTITIPTGSGGGTSDFTQLTNVPSGLVSSSAQILGGSGILSGSHTDISSLNNFTASYSTDSASFDSRISTLEGRTDNTGSDSQTLTIVGDQLTISGGNTITIPTGSGGGGITDISSLNNFTSSADTRITNLENFSSSLDSTFATDSELSSLSSSIATTIGNIQHTQIPSGVISGSTFTDFSSSVESRLSTLEGQTDLTGSDSQTLSIVGDQLSISGGNTITIPTGSGEPTDISSLNTFTSSIQTEVDGLSAATSSYLTELPSGLVSGSVLTTLDGTGVLSGSILPGTNITIDSSSGDYVISSTASGGSGSGDVSFDGDRAISNTLLGDLYTDGFNAGTTGSIQDFLTAVFFPSYAPTATFITQTSNLNTNLATENGVIETFTLTDEDSNTPYSATISGTNASSFKLVPQNSNSSSWEIQAATDLSAGSYTYDITVTDSNNDTRTYSGRSVTIAQADTGTLSTTGTLYIIESATTGPIYLGTNGRGGSQGGVSVSYSPNYGSQVATNFQSSNPLISVNSSTGVLSVGSAISGSGNVSGDLITTTISWTDQYGNTDSSDININVTQNNAPDITFTNSSRLNTNQAVSGGGTLVTISFNDTESDSINYDSFVFTDTSGQLTTTKSGGNYLVTANSNLSGSTTYSISATIEDVHGFRSNTESHSFTITQGGIGTLTGDTTMYIIESAVSGDSFRDATGFGNGNVADVNVTYSPSAGSQTVQSFNSTNPAIQIDSNGNMTLGVNLSGSVTQSGDTISTTITFQDQYGNIGSGSVTANVFGNNAPSVSFVSASNYDTDTATNGSTAGTITISDTESNSPYIVTLGGTDGTKFNAVPQNAASSSWLVQPTASISTSNTYSIDISVTDNYGESTSLTNKSIVVDEVALGATVYVYTLPIDGSYNNVTGITAAGSGTPPTPTIATSYGFFTSFVDNDALGDSTITVSYGSNFTATLRGSASGNNVDTVLDDLGALTIGGSPASERIFVFIPFGSPISGVPTSLTTSDPGGSSTSGEYIVFVSPDGTYQDSSAGLGNDIKSANIHKLTLDTAVDGYTDWIVIGTEDKFNNANAYVRIVPSSGSVPS